MQCFFRDYRYNFYMPKLCINIDHIATVREARKTIEPDPILGAKLAIEGGADGITVHLREDRRHINDRDVLLISQLLCHSEPIRFAQGKLREESHYSRRSF